MREQPNEGVALYSQHQRSFQHHAVDAQGEKLIPAAQRILFEVEIIGHDGDGQD
jgi:hypothetical protein